MWYFRFYAIIAGGDWGRSHKCTEPFILTPGQKPTLNSEQNIVVISISV